jgi:hypothetical protein
LRNYLFFVYYLYSYFGIFWRKVEFYWVYCFSIHWKVWLIYLFLPKPSIFFFYQFPIFLLLFWIVKSHNLIIFLNGNVIVWAYFKFLNDGLFHFSYLSFSFNYLCIDISIATIFLMIAILNFSIWTFPIKHLQDLNRINSMNMQI